jgi:hypothetical protein
MPCGNGGWCRMGRTDKLTPGVKAGKIYLRESTRGETATREKLPHGREYSRRNCHTGETATWERVTPPRGVAVAAG